MPGACAAARRLACQPLWRGTEARWASSTRPGPWWRSAGSTRQGASCGRRRCCRSPLIILVLVAPARCPAAGPLLFLGRRRQGQRGVVGRRLLGSGRVALLGGEHDLAPVGAV